jgi:hypothetical protein
MTWGVYEYHDSVHVVKCDEIEEHYFIECQCGVKYQDGVYVHESLYGDDVDLNGIVDEPFGNC